MADDIVLNPGSGGQTVSTEQLTSGGDSSHAQRIKLITGAAHVDGGDVTPSNGLPVAQVDNAGNVIGTATRPTRIDPTGTTTQPVSGTVTTTQGTAAGLGGAWPIELTDGTHTMPTADAAARALFVEVTDGTHTLPTGDAVARSVNVQVNDGTNVLGTTAHPVRVADAGTDAVNAVEATANLPMAGTTYAPSFSPNLASAGANVKNAAGNLRSLCGTNRNAALRWLQVFNKASAPAGSDVPIFQVPLPPGGSTTPTSVLIGEDFFSNQGINLSTGISIGVSTTSGSYTAATSADHDFFATYK